MNIANFFKPVSIHLIDNFLDDLSVKEMINQIANTIDTFFSTNKTYISPTAHISPTAVLTGDVYIGDNVTIEDYVVLKGPVIIYDNTYIGQHALIRNNSIIGYGNIIGHSCEVSNSIIMNDTTIAHYNVITCSLIGSNVNFSAFASTASFLLKNKKIKKLEEPIVLHTPDGGLYKASSLKFGSIVGDNCRIGAFALLDPGVIMEKDCIIYPLLNVSSNYYIKESSLYIEDYRAKFFIQIGMREKPLKIETESSCIKAIKIDD